ncbi:MAG: methyltransferase [Thermoguttaceae bacterium]
MTEKRPDRQKILDRMADFMSACVIGAAAELDLFTLLGCRPLSADEVADQLRADRRATAMLLDAVAALDLLDKQDDRYRLPDELLPLLSEEGTDNILPMVRHRMNVLRGWSQLAWVTRAGIPGPRQASIRGPAGDREAFIAAMHTYSGPVADELVARLGPPKFKHLLDVGGASGTWTLAFLRAVEAAKATIFDLPDALGQARQRIGRTEFAERIDFAPGDFYVDDLPVGADYAWVSAIVHQHSREHNRDLFAKVHAALAPGGRIAIRDIVMKPSRTEPLEGAMFAINMLVHTDTGGTFTMDELAEDLQAAGFVEPRLEVEDEAMNSVVVATKPS